MLGFLMCLLGVWYFLCLPRPLFSDPYATVLHDRHGALLGALIASDGQWRFPPAAQTPERFNHAIVQFEDKRFFYHPGFDVIALVRSLYQNIQAGKVLSGGSTLSMQVIRLARKGRPRNLWNKTIEIILATRLELRYSKDEILQLFAANAPFGGNVVGLDAACWRYFGRAPNELSWGDAALLAVLPNNPSWMHLARNREALKTKRDKLLVRLLARHLLDTLSFNLAVAEPIPDQPFPLPRLAPHLLDRLRAEGHDQQQIVTTIDAQLQQRATQLVQDHAEVLAGNQIFNAAALIVHVPTGEVMAYVGNSAAGARHHEHVDVIRSPRSSGSILKPLLFAAMLDEGKMLTRTIQPDIPTLLNGFAPKNFSRQYDGAVAASDALIRSLNVPAVHQLRTYRYEKFYNLLVETGITTLNQPADHYGLSLILGGAEATLFDVTGVYASMARTLNNYFQAAGANRYAANNFRAPHFILADSVRKFSGTLGTGPLSAASIYLTFDVLKEVYRPGEETGWQYFNNAKTIAWKTGTSMGFRDAWAVGVNGDYAVGVWAGNADGEGRPGLTGTVVAAPLLFSIFSMLPENKWFDVPLAELQRVAVCSSSGYRATDKCTSVDTVFVTARGLQTAPCPYHQWVWLSPDGRHRVNNSCALLANMKKQAWFVLPPVQEYYYKNLHLSYKTLPAYLPACDQANVSGNMEIIYPQSGSKIFIPRQLDGTLSESVFQVAHRGKQQKVYWHIDNTFIGLTETSHRLSVTPLPGKHVLTIVDEEGESVTTTFEVLQKPR